MLGPRIMARTIQSTRIKGSWQYHARSDAHSKAACWGIAFDLLDQCPLLREHVVQGKVGFGINHEMCDFRLNRKKNLDLVLCQPREPIAPEARDFAALASDYGIVLFEDERAKLAALPPLREAQVGAVRMALEAKAAMTAHQRAAPRLFDELTSSHATVHGDSADAIAVGFVVVNCAGKFRSATRARETGTPVWSAHRPLTDARIIVDKVKQIARSSHVGEVGFDALGVVALDFENDGGEVRLLDPPPAELGIDDNFTYERMIHRASQFYASRWSRV